MSKALTFTDANFQSDVLESKEPVLVDFWATWCPPCRAIGPMIDELAGEYAGSVKIGKLDVDDNQVTVARYSVERIPAILVFLNGEIYERFSGAQAKPRLQASLDAACGRST